MIIPCPQIQRAQLKWTRNGKSNKAQWHVSHSPATLACKTVVNLWLKTVAAVCTPPLPCHSSGIEWRIWIMIPVQTFLKILFLKLLVALLQGIMRNLFLLYLVIIFHFTFLHLSSWSGPRNLAHPPFFCSFLHFSLLIQTLFSPFTQHLLFQKAVPDCPCRFCASFPLLYTNLADLISLKGLKQRLTQ